MNIAQIACGFLVVSSAMVSLYALYLVATESGLARKFRALVGAGFWLAVSGHYASVLGWLPSLLDDHSRAYSLWALTAFFAALTLVQRRTKNEQTRRLLTPVFGAMFVANVLILVFYRLG